MATALKYVPIARNCALIAKSRAPTTLFRWNSQIKGPKNSTCLVPQNTGRLREREMRAGGGGGGTYQLAGFLGLAHLGVELLLGVASDHDAFLGRHSSALVLTR
jgi:hypothetical protein